MRLKIDDIKMIQSLTSFDFSQVAGKTSRNSKFNTACTELTNKIRNAGAILQQVADAESLNPNQVKKLANVVQELSRCCKKFQAAAGEVNGVVLYSELISSKLNEIDTVVTHIEEVANEYNAEFLKIHSNLFAIDQKNIEFRTLISSGRGRPALSEKITFLKKFIEEEGKWRPILTRLLGLLTGKGWINNSTVLEQLEREVNAIGEEMNRLVTNFRIPEHKYHSNSFKARQNGAQIKLQNIRETIQKMSVKSLKAENKEALIAWIQWFEDGLTILGEDIQAKEKLLVAERGLRDIQIYLRMNSYPDIAKLSELKKSAESLKVEVKSLGLAEDSTQKDLERKVLQGLEQQIRDLSSRIEGIYSNLIGEAKIVHDKVIEIEQRFVNAKTFEEYRALAEDSATLLDNIAGIRLRDEPPEFNGMVQEAKKKAMAVFMKSIPLEHNLRKQAIEEKRQDVNIGWQKKIDFFEVQIKELTDRKEPKLQPKIGEIPKKPLEDLHKLKNELLREKEELKKALKLIPNQKKLANNLAENLSNRLKWVTTHDLFDDMMQSILGYEVEGKHLRLWPGKERQALMDLYSENVKNLRDQTEKVKQKLANDKL